MTEKNGLRKLYDQFNFLALQPLKINAALFVDLVMIGLSLLELDALENGILKRFFTFCLILNVVLIVGSLSTLLVYRTSQIACMTKNLSIKDP